MYRHHNYEERLNIVSRILSGESIDSICRELKLDRKMVVQWRLRYQKYGEKGLENKRRGRPPKDMARPKKREPQTELEKLQAENLRLRAENALLKKVKALVEEQEAHSRLNGQKPSTN